ncbi:hypothetical protein NKH77_33870 [Streptomyces sp. M19]
MALRPERRPARRHPEEQALTEALTAEIREATTIVLGIPMYNYTIRRPSRRGSTGWSSRRT